MRPPLSEYLTGIAADVRDVLAHVEDHTPNRWNRRTLTNVADGLDELAEQIAGERTAPDEQVVARRRSKVYAAMIDEKPIRTMFGWRWLDAPEAAPRRRCGGGPHGRDEGRLVISEVRDELGRAAAAFDLDLTQAPAIARAIAAGARAAGLEVLTLEDLHDIADAIPRPREEPW